MRVGFLCVIGALACCGTAVAEDGCGRFAWPVQQERTALLAPGQPEVSTGETLFAMPRQALSLQLAPTSDVQFEMPPSASRKTGLPTAAPFAFPHRRHPASIRSLCRRTPGSTSCRMGDTPARSAAAAAEIAPACARQFGSISPQAPWCCRSAALPQNRFQSSSARPAKSSDRPHPADLSLTERVTGIDQAVAPSALTVSQSALSSR